MFLLDTNVVSALAPHNVDRHPELVAWMRRNDRLLRLSVVTASEVEAGIAKAVRTGARAKSASLRKWWAGLVELYDDRILQVDLRIAEAAGQMLDEARAHDPGYEDILIAATARVHGMTVLTRNERHFAPLGVDVVDPFVRLP
ncbi:MAG: type II toxin-antitoxin system VapC family toxin [Rhizobiales bacterium]|nr:type II toxin-antitoxin system VapC family toxin [Hyphomicrobiales bacterium]OJU35407.1 MAG: VapC toxin family PIN domain ribonuclease [Rhizobiales bacterium 68-8]